MTRGEMERMFIEAINDLRKQVFVPYRTGNLKFNAIKGIWVTKTQFKIYIDEKIAPYVFFTNEQWQNGNNPNKGWVDKMHKHLAQYISRRLGGNIK